MYLKTLTLASLLALTVSAPTMMIDSFSPVNHADDLVFGDLTHSNQSLVAAQSGNMIGGERDVEILQAQDPIGTRDPQIFAGYHEVPILHQFHYFVGARGTGTGGSSFEAYITLQYDGAGDENGNTGINKRLNNVGSGSSLFEGTERGIRMRYYYNRQAIGVVATLRQQGSVIAESQLALDTVGSTLTDADFPFSPQEMAAADSLSIRIRISVNPSNKEGIFIESISTIVPEVEPGMVVGGALAMMGVMSRRRKARQ